MTLGIFKNRKRKDFPKYSATASIRLQIRFNYCEIKDYSKIDRSQKRQSMSNSEKENKLFLRKTFP